MSETRQTASAVIVAMPNVKALRRYQDALEHYRKGESGEAAQALSEALGTPEPSAVIKGSLERLLEKGTLANDAILTVLATEVSKGEKHE